MDIALQISNLDEGYFISALLNNERWAQKLLYEEQYPVLMSIAMRYANNEEDALDILHESYIKIFTNIHRYEVNTSFNSWLKRVLVNSAVDYYWKEIKRKTENIDKAFYLKSDIPDPISDLSTEEIINSIQQLQPNLRSIFNMFVIEGYSHREIAKKLRINESTCRANLVKARTILKGILIAKERKT